MYVLKCGLICKVSVFIVYRHPVTVAAYRMCLDNEDELRVVRAN